MKIAKADLAPSGANLQCRLSGWSPSVHQARLTSGISLLHRKSSAAIHVLRCRIWADEDDWPSD